MSDAIIGCGQIGRAMGKAFARSGIQGSFATMSTVNEPWLAALHAARSSSA